MYVRNLVLLASVAAAAALLGSGPLGGGGEAEAQVQELRIGVLVSDPAGRDLAILEALNMSRDDLNADYESIDRRVVLDIIDVSEILRAFDPRSGAVTNPEIYASVAQKIGSSLRDGFGHFIAPSDSFVLAAVYPIISSASPGSMMISPASSSTVPPYLLADDNLFRLVPNSNDRIDRYFELFDAYGMDRVIMVSDPFLGPIFSALAPDDLHDHIDSSIVPVQMHAQNDPAHRDKNLRSAERLDGLIADAKAEFGDDRVGVYVFSTSPFYANFAKVLADNPQLGHVGSVMWVVAPPILRSPAVVADPVVAEFSAGVSLTASTYVVEENEINAKLTRIQIQSGSQEQNDVYAAYDALHLLADSMILAEQRPGLGIRDAIYAASDGVHPILHLSRILGEGAMGDYSLSRTTGDLVGGGSFVEHRFVKAGGGYDWVEIKGVLVCR